MRLRVLGSSSKGNCYLLYNDSEVLVIEAGVKFSAIKEALNFDFSKVVGVLCTHEHKDHALSVKDFLEAGINVIAPESVFESVGINSPCCVRVKENHTVTLRNFSVQPFALQHDVPIYGYLIHHEEMGNTVFITDTGDINYSFKNLNNIIVEANFSDSILVRNAIDGLGYTNEKRLRDTHLSLEKCVDWLSAVDLKNVNNIVLIHLSERNSDAEMFKETVEKQFAKNVYVADKGLDIDFNRIPF
jgi:Metal-dependent hydrolases of the beta-lactamase superfamily I